MKAWLFVMGIVLVLSGGLAGGLAADYVLPENVTKSVDCFLLNPITRFTDYRQQYFNERCRHAYFSTRVPVDESVNIIRFDLEFVSEPGADGIFTASVDDTVVASIRESEAQTGIREYTFDIPERSSGEMELAFRLVPTTDVKSNITLKNVKTGYKSLRQPEDPLFAVRKNPELDFAEVASPARSGENATLENGSISLDTGPGPAWIAVPLQVAEEISFLEFDLEFAGAEGSEGLLAFYLDDELLATFDERYSDRVMTDEALGLPGKPPRGNLPAGFYTLSIRLDAYSDVPSRARIFNLQTALVEKNY